VAPPLLSDLVAALWIEGNPSAAIFSFGKNKPNPPQGGTVGSPYDVRLRRTVPPPNGKRKFYMQGKTYGFPLHYPFPIIGACRLCVLATGT